MKKINIKDVSVCVVNIKNDDYISLTDIARIKNSKEPKDVVKNWLRLRSTLEYCGLWEKINNPNFRGVEFDPILSESGKNSFTMSPERWIRDFSSIGIISKPIKNGGTFAHKDIALEFASWISPEIKLYIIKEFQRLKSEETDQLEWNGQRILAKLNYYIHTDAIKNNLIPVNLTIEQINYIYASEADLLNVALFGMKASEWKKLNPDKKGNIRDYASIIELSILSNIEYHNAILIKDGFKQKERLLALNKSANEQKEIFNKNTKNEVKIIENEQTK